MAENIYEILKNESPALAAKLDTNEDVSTFLMGLYAHLLKKAQESPKNVKDLRCAVSIEKERLLIIRTRYESESEGKAFIGDHALASQRNINLVKMLQVNSSVKNLAVEVVYRLEKWINEIPYRKQQGFEKIKLDNAMLWRSGEFTAEIILKFEFDEFVAAKTKWGMDDPEQENEGSLIQ